VLDNRSAHPNDEGRTTTTQLPDRLHLAHFILLTEEKNSERSLLPPQKCAFWLSSLMMLSLALIVEGFGGLRLGSLEQTDQKYRTYFTPSRG
jgi:hypothetical protein